MTNNGFNGRNWQQKREDTNNKEKRVGLKKNKKMNYIGKAWKASVSEWLIINKLVREFAYIVSLPLSWPCARLSLVYI